MSTVCRYVPNLGTSWICDVIGEHYAGANKTVHVLPEIKPGCQARSKSLRYEVDVFDVVLLSCNAVWTYR